MKYKAQFGSISHGTMRNEDLIQTFADELERLDAEKQFNKLLNDAHILCIEAEDAEDYETDQANAILEELFDALNQFAPSYAYFGAHPGDGSDYGFWLSDDLAENFDGWIIDDSQKGAGEPPADYCGEILHINDHGNTSLLVQQDGKREIIWALV